MCVCVFVENSFVPWRIAVRKKRDDGCMSWGRERESKGRRKEKGIEVEREREGERKRGKRKRF